MAYIELDNVNLYYSSLAFRERSLKKAVFNFFRPNSFSTGKKDIHALKNISVKICEGERVALLGHNGAGKSSFLKMLADLYPVSSGTRIVEGQIRSLFELAIGFEYEATGRENIMYRGLLLGLSPREVKAQSQEIIDFADLGEFIDYPIKTYSAGMLVRLAFAISTSLPGQILLLDEIMGAGDMKFMKKAKERMAKLINDAEIIIFATHDFESAREICERGIVFRNGNVIFDGEINAAVESQIAAMEK